MIDSVSAFDKVVTALKEVGRPPAQAVVTIAFAKELYQIVSPQFVTEPTPTEDEFLASIKRGEAEFEGIKLKAAW